MNLEPGWLKTELASIDAEIAKWPTGIRQSFDRTHKPITTSAMARTEITIPMADYKRLLQAAESDSCIVICEICGAWLDTEDPETATVEDFTGCWSKATDSPRYSEQCKSYRALEQDEK